MIFLLLDAIANRFMLGFVICFNSVKKQIYKTDRKMKKRGKEGQLLLSESYRAITKRGPIEKSPILLSQYWKNTHFHMVPKIILHFRGTNNIFVDCIKLNRFGLVFNITKPVVNHQITIILYALNSSLTLISTIGFIAPIKTLNKI